MMYLEPGNLRNYYFKILENGIQSRNALRFSTLQELLQPVFDQCHGHIPLELENTSYELSCSDEFVVVKAGRSKEIKINIVASNQFINSIPWEMSSDRIDIQEMYIPEFLNIPKKDLAQLKDEMTRFVKSRVIRAKNIADGESSCYLPKDHRFYKAFLHCDYHWNTIDGQVVVEIDDVRWEAILHSTIELDEGILRFDKHVMDGLKGDRFIDGEKHFISLKDMVKILGIKGRYFNERLKSRVDRGESLVHFNVNGSVLRLMVTLDKKNEKQPYFIIASLYWPLRGAFKEMSDVQFENWKKTIPQITFTNS